MSISGAILRAGDILANWPNTRRNVLEEIMLPVECLSSTHQHGWVSVIWMIHSSLEQIPKALPHIDNARLSVVEAKLPEPRQPLTSIQPKRRGVISS